MVWHTVLRKVNFRTCQNRIFTFNELRFFHSPHHTTIVIILYSTIGIYQTTTSRDYPTHQPSIPTNQPILTRESDQLHLYTTTPKNSLHSKNIFTMFRTSATILLRSTARTRPFSTTPLIFKSVAETVSDTAEAINRKAGNAALKGIETTGKVSLFVSCCTDTNVELQSK